MTIKVLVVDDSPTARLALSNMLQSAPDMCILGQATDGRQAVEMTQSLRPDIVLMDVVMPGMDGLAATREIMDVCPTPIVVVSSTLSSSETNVAFEAINAGALSVLQKPVAVFSPAYPAMSKGLLDTLRAMASVQVIRHIRMSRPGSSNGYSAKGYVANGYAATATTSSSAQSFARPEIISIASSTGGPQTLAEILKGLPASFRLPIAIIQHIGADFVEPLAAWLGSVVTIPVRIAQADERPLPGTVYLAPGGRHMILNAGKRFAFTDNPSDVPHIPSGDVLLNSVAVAYRNCAVGVVLTGMGRDGAFGLKAMYDAGAMTIAQDEATSVVFGMPKEAIALGAARQVMPPSDISKLLHSYSL